MATEKRDEEFAVPQNPEVVSTTKDLTNKTPLNAATDLSAKKRKGFARNFMSPTDALVSPCTKQLMGNRRQANLPARHKLINSMGKPAPVQSQLADQANRQQGSGPTSPDPCQEGEEQEEEGVKFPVMSEAEDKENVSAAVTTTTVP